MLASATKYYKTNFDCRNLLDNNLHSIVKVLLHRSTAKKDTELNKQDKFGLTELDYIEKSIRFALRVINDDLKINAPKITAKSKTLEALTLIFIDVYYNKTRSMRKDKVKTFQNIKGFYHLAIYIDMRSGTDTFPDWLLVHLALEATQEGILTHQEDSEFLLNFRKVAAHLVAGVFKHMSKMKRVALEKVEVIELYEIISDLHRLSWTLAMTDSNAMPKYFSFCRDTAHTLLLTMSEEHQKFGRELITTCIRNIHETLPLINSVEVKGAGKADFNGIYTLSPHNKSIDGFIIPGVDTPRYEKVVAGCTNRKLVMRKEDGSNPHFLSEEFCDGLLTYKHTNHYFNLPEHTSRTPPSTGWICLDDLLSSPAPTVEVGNDMIPILEDHKTLKEDFARWFLTKNVAKLLLGEDIHSSVSPTSMKKLSESFDSLDGDMTSDSLADVLDSVLPLLVSESSSTDCLQTSPSLASDNVFSCETLQSSVSQDDGPVALEAAKQALVAAELLLETKSQVYLAAKKEKEDAEKLVVHAYKEFTELELEQKLAQKELTKTVDKQNFTRRSLTSQRSLDKTTKNKQERRISFGTSVRGLASAISTRMLFNDAK